MNTSPSTFTLLDGPLLPNEALDGARALAFDAPDDLVACVDGRLLVSSGNAIYSVRSPGRKPSKPVARFGGSVTALCRLPDERIVAAVQGEGLYAVEGAKGKAELLSADTRLRDRITACTAAADGSILATCATTEPGIYPYTHELFARRGSGQLLKVTGDGACSVLADGLCGPHGVAIAQSGAVLVAETWDASVSRLEPCGRRDPVLSGFAGYPGRITPLAAGGFLMACLSRRDPLVDFIRGERRFAERMIREIEPAHWVAPRLESSIDVNLPGQAGATRLFGEIKPWAPSLSYGLVCELNERFVPRASHHSRANGVRHGIVAAVEWQDRIACVSKATKEVLFLEPRGLSDAR